MSVAVSHGSQSTELSRYLQVPRRRWRVVLLVFGMVLGLVVLYLVLGPRTYTSTAVVELQAITTSPFDETKSGSQLIDVDTAAKTAASKVVAAAAAEEMPGREPAWMLRHVTIRAVSGTTTLSVQFEASDAKESAAGANAFADASLSSRGKWATDRRDALIEANQANVDDLQKQLAAVNKSLAGADPDTARAQDDASTKTLLIQQINDLSVKQNSLRGMSIDPGQVISSPDPGEAAVSPQRRTVLIGGAVLALLCGVVVAFARDATDGRLRSATQLEALIGAGVVAAAARTRPEEPDDALYVLRTRIARAVAENAIPAVLFVDLARPERTGRVCEGVAGLLHRSGTEVELLVVSEEGTGGSGGGARPPWLPTGLRTTRFTLQRDDPTAGLDLVRARLTEAAAVGVLAMVTTQGAVRRSVVLSLAALVEETVVVSQSGATTLNRIQTTVRDVGDCGGHLFGGVFLGTRALAAVRSSVRPFTREVPRGGRGRRVPVAPDPSGAAPEARALASVTPENGWPGASPEGTVHPVPSPAGTPAPQAAVRRATVDLTRPSVPATSPIPLVREKSGTGLPQKP